LPSLNANIINNGRGQSRSRVHLPGWAGPWLAITVVLCAGSLVALYLLSWVVSIVGRSEHPHRPSTSGSSPFSAIELNRFGISTADHSQASTTVQQIQLFLQVALSLLLIAVVTNHRRG